MDDDQALRRSRRIILILWVVVLVLLLGAYVLPQLGWWPSGQVGNPRPITARGDLAADEQTTIELFRESGPSVVYMTTQGRRVNPWTREVTDVPQGTGSGFIWDEQGHVVTNFHVIRTATAAQVVMHDHSSYAAKLVGVSPDHDLAVLRITAAPGKLRPVPIGTDHDLEVGQKVFAIGNPFGLDQTLTTGIVSGLGRRIKGAGDRPIEDAIQTDAAINPGNSGGPLLDSAGRLIGVNTSIVSPSGAYAGVGFAVPVDTVNRVVPQLIAAGEYAPPRIGIRIDDRASRAILGRRGIKGILILAVQPGSGADRAGLKGHADMPDGSVAIGDVIQQVAGQKVENRNDLRNALDRRRAGDTVTLKIQRDGKTRSVDVELQSR